MSYCFRENQGDKDYFVHDKLDRQYDVFFAQYTEKGIHP